MAEEARVKACNECRQQKLRCDAIKDYSRPCTRCRKFSLECVVSTSFKRRRKHNKADLQREIDSLRQELRTHSSVAANSLKEAALTVSDSSTRDTNTQLTRLSDDSSLGAPWQMSNFTDGSNLLQHNTTHLDMGLSMPQPSSGSIVFPPPDLADHGSGISTQHEAADVRSATSLDLLSFPKRGSALARSLDGESIDGRKITDCFLLFHEHYAPSIPEIFGTDIVPDTCYAESPLLFWSIVCTGSRKYKDPTLLARLSERIVPLALRTIMVNSQPLHAIKAALLLCCWPMPINTLYKNPSQALAGAALMLALQTGLHILGRGEEFADRPSKLPMPPFSRDMSSNTSDNPNNLIGPKLSVRYRAQLWICCLIAFQRINLCDGLPYMLISESFEVAQYQPSTEILPECLCFAYKLHRLQTEGVAAILRTIDLAVTGTSSELDKLIEHYDIALSKELTSDADGKGQLMYYCALLSIRAFHFFSDSTSSESIGYVRLYILACETINSVSSESEPYLNQYSTRMITLAAYTIFRITRSHLGEKVDLIAGEDTFFRAISISRNRSIQNNDLDSINAKMLTQLWSSRKVFKIKNVALDPLRLNLRERLSMSVVFDCFWWWRIEFGDLRRKDSTIEEDAQQPMSNVGSYGHETTQGLAFAGETATLSAIDNSFWNQHFNGYPDWDWAATVSF